MFSIRRLNQHCAIAELIAVALVVSFFVSSCAAGKERWVPGTPLPAWADPQRVLDESQMGQKVKRELQAFVGERQNKIDAAEEKLKAMEGRIKAQSPSINEEKEAFKKAVGAHQELVKKLNVEVQEKKDFSLGQFNAALERAVRKVSEQWTPGSGDPNLLVVQILDRAAGFEDVQSPLASKLGSENPQIALTQVHERLLVLVTELSARFKDLSVQSVAVLPFVGSSDKNPDSLGDYLTDKVTNVFFVAGRSKVVERAAIGKVMDELALGYTGNFDDTSAKRVGRLVNADTLIRGKYVEIAGGMIEVTARAISVETGEIVGVGSTTIPAGHLLKSLKR